MTCAISGRASDPLTIAIPSAPSLQSGAERPLAEVVTDTDAAHVERVDGAIVAAAIGRETPRIPFRAHEFERLRCHVLAPAKWIRKDHPVKAELGRQRVPRFAQF